MTFTERDLLMSSERPPNESQDFERINWAGVSCVLTIIAMIGGTIKFVGIDSSLATLDMKNKKIEAAKGSLDLQRAKTPLFSVSWEIFGVSDMPEGEWQFVDNLLTLKNDGTAAVPLGKIVFRAAVSKDIQSQQRLQPQRTMKLPTSVLFRLILRVWGLGRSRMVFLQAKST
jgi:hypothetical protein